MKSCANRLIVTFQEISEVFAFYEYDKGVFRCFANCFSKGYAIQSTDGIKRQKTSGKYRYHRKKGSVKVLLVILVKTDKKYQTTYSH